MPKITVLLENAGKMHSWITGRGGIAAWRSIDLSDPGAEAFTPAISHAVSGMSGI